MKCSRVKAVNLKPTATYWRQILVGWIFALFWLAFVGVFDAYMVSAATRQVVAARTSTPVLATIVELVAG